MTNLELAEMTRRDRVQEEYPRIAAAAVGDDWSEELLEGLLPEASFGAFAGRWIDQQDGGKLKLALVRSHPGHDESRQRSQAVIDALVAASRIAETDVEFVDAIFTADDLHKVNREFAAEYLEGTAIDRQTVGMSASMNPVENRVDLYVEPDWLEIARKFAAQYPAKLVEVVEVPKGFLTITSDTAPRDDWGAGNWHAGAGINIDDGNGYIGNCAWGATAQTSSYVYVITAAHCLGSAYASNSLGATGWYNSSKPLSGRRGVIDSTRSDWIASPNTGYVYVYHGVRGDLARLSISHTSNVTDYDCYLKNETICGQSIFDRSLTTETEIGDTVCVALYDRGYVCAAINSNDAPISGYDYLRAMNTNSGNHSMGGDSGAGVHEGLAMTGIVKGYTGWWGYDTYMTHAYYVETSGYLAATGGICGSTGLCDN